MHSIKSNSATGFSGDDADPEAHSILKKSSENSKYKVFKISDEAIMKIKAKMGVK